MHRRWFFPLNLLVSLLVLQLLFRAMHFSPLLLLPLLKLFLLLLLLLSLLKLFLLLQHINLPLPVSSPLLNLLLSSSLLLHLIINPIRPLQQLPH